MSAPCGYHGCYLRVDLTHGQAQSVPLDEHVLRRYLGGSGLGAYLLCRENSAAARPLAADASIAFVFSPLVGSPLTTSAKFAVVSKSPLTGRFNDSLASSGFAMSGKKAGCDAIVLTGRAPQPSIVVIDDGDVQIVPAGELWGTACPVAAHRLKEQFGEKFQSAVIGPAGEHQVHYATISHDKRHAGRGGNGAVLGAKNVKALLVAGTRRCRWSDTAGLAKLARSLSAASFGPATAKYRELGTAANLLVFNRLRALPTRNFQLGSFPHAEALSPESMSAARLRTRASCAACTIGCEHLYSIENHATSGDKGASRQVRVEYENLFALGPLCGIADPAAVLNASLRCDELGIDTISAGGTIAFAMECAERGLLDAPWLRFGDSRALLRAIEEIAARRELGGRLADGSRRLAEWIGQDSIDFAPQVKGLEVPGYEPRALQTMALGFAVGTRGADHNRSGAYEVDFSERADRRQLSNGSVALAIQTEDAAALMDSLILCKFLRGVFDDLFVASAEMLQLVTGWDVDAEELRQTAQRIVTAKKMFNIRAGWTPVEDALPRRFITQPLDDDRQAKLSINQLQEAIRAYNVQRGWSPEGWVGKARCEQLQLLDLLE